MVKCYLRPEPVALSSNLAIEYTPGASHHTPGFHDALVGDQFQNEANNMPVKYREFAAGDCVNFGGVSTKLAKDFSCMR